MTSRRASYHVPERFLRQLWKHRHFSSFNLRTSDNQPLEIISPGTLNHDGGPDFLDACIRIGGTLLRGNIELHEFDHGWTGHNHHTDPKYNAVILHVVFRTSQPSNPMRTKSKRSVPLLILESHLKSSFRSTWEKMIAGERSERTEVIKCFATNDRVDSVLIRKWLMKLSIQRVELKVRRAEERLKEMVEEQRLVINEPYHRYDEIPFGLNPEELPPPIAIYSAKDFGKVRLWEQLLYEGVMEALGYAKNQQPFLKLARSTRLAMIAQLIDTVSPNNELLCIEALLFGAGGLLPLSRDMTDRDSKHHLLLLRELWKSASSSFHTERVHQSEWQFFRLRPENFPTVRLAGAVRLVKSFLRENTFKSLVQTVKAADRGSEDKLHRLEQMFIIPADGFWKHHFRFGQKSSGEVKTLIGKHRADEILLNVVIPICLLYARIFKDKEVRQGILKIYEQCPSLSDNTITRTMENQLLKRRFTLDSAMLQQGAVQLNKCYCVEERCAECAVGKSIF